MPGQHCPGTESRDCKFSGGHLEEGGRLFCGEKMQNKQKNIRLPIEMMERLRKYVATSGYTITQVWLAALDDYLTARGY